MADHTMLRHDPLQPDSNFCLCNLCRNQSCHLLLAAEDQSCGSCTRCSCCLASRSHLTCSAEAPFPSSRATRSRGLACAPQVAAFHQAVVLTLQGWILKQGGGNFKVVAGHGRLIEDEVSLGCQDGRRRLFHFGSFMWTCRLGSFCPSVCRSRLAGVPFDGPGVPFDGPGWLGAC